MGYGRFLIQNMVFTPSHSVAKAQRATYSVRSVAQCDSYAHLPPHVMHTVSLHYQLHPPSAAATPPAALRIANPLLGLLQAVAQAGSISAAARSLGLSYRHVWGELKRWELQLGQPLLLWDKGQAARLSEFGNKLLFAERQAQARLAPQMDALQAELERSFALAFDPQAQVLSLYASHDEALGRLRSHCAQTAQLHLDIQFTGSVDAIRALNEGRCVLAGFHTLLPSPAGSKAQKTYRPLLQPGQHKIIGFAQRTQGLIVAKGNPLKLHSLSDIVRSKARYINRALGTGTRLILDELLAQQRIKPSQLPGYRRSEPSHAAVAQTVANGEADVGLGIEAVAVAQGLGFVPLVSERYDLVCLNTVLIEPAIQSLLKVLGSSTWRAQCNAIAGYEALQSGEVLSLSQTLPWWDFGNKKGF
jgi:putative molybdopterin biosynthesis protein